LIDLQLRVAVSELGDARTSSRLDELFGALSCWEPRGWRREKQKSVSLERCLMLVKCARARDYCTCASAEKASGCDGRNGEKQPDYLGTAPINPFHRDREMQRVRFRCRPNS